MSQDKVYFEGEFDSDDGGQTPTSVRMTTTNLAQNLTGRRLYNPLKPLKDVYVLTAADPKLPEIIRAANPRWNPQVNHYNWDTSRYNQLKPEWVRAFMTKDDLSFSTDQVNISKRNATLAKIIRARGMQRIDIEPEYDDCGHVVAKWLGGPFIDYNLFPQSFALNRGNWFDGLANFSLWKGVEMFMWLWLRLKGNNPKVEWSVRLYYNDITMEDRPSEMTFSVRFLAGEDEKKEDEDNGRDVVRAVRHLLNTSQVALQSNKTQVRASETYGVLVGLCVRNAPREELLICLRKLINEIEVEEKKPVKVEEKKEDDVKDQLKCAADMLGMINPNIGMALHLATGNREEAAKSAQEQMAKNLVAGGLGCFFGGGKGGFL